MIVHTVEQRSDTWRQLRCGRLTGSRAGDVMRTLKNGGEPADRRDYRLQLCCERLTNQPQEDSFVSADMKRGIEREDQARRAYEAATGAIVRPVGFVAHDTLMAGCSPDGIVGDFGGIVEIKVPKTATHIGYVRRGKVPDIHLAQVQHGLWITGAQWCDFFSFDDRLPVHLQAFRVRLRREDVDLKAYELVVRMFLRECDEELASLIALADGVAA